jgi:uncharacterized protein
MLKVVFDTNIYISGYLFGGKPRQGIEKGRMRYFRLYASRDILDEMEEELAGPPFMLSRNQVHKIIGNMKGFIEILKVASRAKGVRDKKDNMLLDCSLAAKARYLITGDKDLLVMGKFKQVEIITIADFLAREPWA